MFERLLRLCLPLLLMAGITACAFDDDSAFVPQARVAWLLVQDGAARELVRLDVRTGTLVRNPVQLSAPAQHVTGDGTDVYVTTDTSVVVLGGESNTLMRRATVPAGAAMAVVTDEGVFVLNPVRRELQVVLRRNAPDLTLALPLAPTAGIFGTGKVLLASSSGQVQWIHATAFALTASSAIPAGPVMLQRNSLGRIEMGVRQPDQTLHVGVANPQNETITPTFTPAAVVEFAVPQAARLQFGRELLTTVRRLPNGEVRREEGNMRLATGATSLAVDVRQSYAYVTARDSLLRVDVLSGQRVGAWPLRGRIVSSAFMQLADE